MGFCDGVGRKRVSELTRRQKQRIKQFALRARLIRDDIVALKKEYKTLKAVYADVLSEVEGFYASDMSMLADIEHSLRG